MAKVKIKHTSKTTAAKQKLLQILSSQDVYAIDIKEAHDGFIIITSTIEEADVINSPSCTTALTAENFSPVLPPELKAKRTVLLFKVDSHIYDNNEENIKEEVYNHNNFANEEIETIFKFPRANIIKIQFKQAITATKTCEQGLKLFKMKIPHYNIKKEEYTPINVCYKCYKLEDHHTNQCPQEANYKVCSECSSTEHTWTNCNNTFKKCLNCNGDHRTLAFKCPSRKTLVEEKKKAKPQSYSAAVTSTTNTNYFPQLMNPNLFQTTEDPRTLFQKIMSCFVNAHINNAITPGSFETTLNQSLKKNGIAEFKAPNCPDSSQLFSNTQVTNETVTTATNQQEATSPPTHPTQTEAHSEEETEETEGEEEDSDSDSSEVSVTSNTSHNLAVSSKNKKQHRPNTRSENSHTHEHEEHIELPQRPSTSSNYNKQTKKELPLPNTQTSARKAQHKKHRR